MTPPVPPTAAMTLDVLPFKRVLAFEESGSELLPAEPTIEEKPLTLLGRIDFGQTVEKDSKKAKTGKETTPAAPTTWPWQGLVDHLQQAHQELNIILDFLNHVEGNDAITVASMVKPKLLPQETLNDLSLRASSKICQFRDVGKYLRRTAQALERQVEKEAVFYGALMRLQRNWKVKRQRSVAAGSGGSAGFTIDASLSIPPDSMSVSSVRATALSSVNLDQDATGLLQAHIPDGRPLNKLNLSLRCTQAGSTVWECQGMKNANTSLGERIMGGSDASSSDPVNQSVTDGEVGKGVDAGAKAAQAVLRHIQSVIYDEQVFDWVGREAVSPHSGMNVIGIGDTCLQFSLGNATTFTLKLTEIENDGNNGSDGNEGESGDLDGKPGRGEGDMGGNWGASLAGTQTSERRNQELPSSRRHEPRFARDDSSLVVCLHQTFHQAVFGYAVELDPGLVTFKKGVGKSAEKVSAKVKEAAATATTAGATGVAGAMGKEPANIDGLHAIKHLSAIMQHRVLSDRVLAELEKQVYEIPHFQLFLHPTWHPRVSAWDLSLSTPKCAALEGSSDAQEVRFQCTVVLRDDSLAVEGLEGESRFEAPSKASQRGVLPLTKRSIGLSELPSFILFQVATELVSWLHDEARTLGLNVSRDLLSVVVQLDESDHIAIVACPDVKARCINWWLRTWSLGMEDGAQGIDDAGLEGGHHQRFLGPLNLNTLRSIILDLINLENDLEAGAYE